ncbi:hypothetical protein K1T71_015243 [Dendrolimus kikuchii]|nr:hypothetical protein K1T71_015243 [Dendrolimus kikuchii]
MLHIHLVLFSLFYQCLSFNVNNNKLKTVLSWKQVGYNFDDCANSNIPLPFFFFSTYHEPNISCSFDLFYFRIPSTLNYINLSSLSSSSPLLKPYPNVESRSDFVSIYRPRIDSCDRMWMVDTGLYEVPNARRQIQKPAIIIYDLKTNEKILRQELSDDIIVSERTTGGLTTLVVDIVSSCDDAFAYINDLATNGLIVFSLRTKDSWRLDHESFRHDPRALNFTAAGQLITWQDGLFSISLSEPVDGRKRIYYHSLASYEEYSIDTEYLKNKALSTAIASNIQLFGTRGPNSQSGSHAYHSTTRIIFFANLARDAITCWNVDKMMIPENVPVLVMDNEKLAYISDLKVIGDEVWVLVNKIPRFALSSLNPSEYNFFVHKASIRDLIKGTACE